MWMTSNFRAKALKAFLLSMTLAAPLMAPNSISGEHIAPAKHPINIKQANLVTLDKATEMQVLGKRKLPFKGKFYVFKVETQQVVNLNLSSSPMILINGQPSITRFAPYQASTFYAFVPQKDIKKGNNAISMVWPDMPIDQSKTSTVTLSIR